MSASIIDIKELRDMIIEKINELERKISVAMQETNEKRISTQEEIVTCLTLVAIKILLEMRNIPIITAIKAFEYDRGKNRFYMDPSKLPPVATPVRELTYREYQLIENFTQLLNKSLGPTELQKIPKLLSFLRNSVSIAVIFLGLLTFASFVVPSQYYKLIFFIFFFIPILVYLIVIMYPLPRLYLYLVYKERDKINNLSNKLENICKDPELAKTLYAIMEKF